MRVVENTAFIDARTPASDISNVRESIIENAASLKEIVLEGGIDSMETSMLLQLLVAVKKSYPAITMTLFEGDEVKTLNWGRWELK